MRAECKQEEGYARTVQIRDKHTTIELHLSDHEARQFVAAIAYGFSNLATAEHVWAPILEAAS